MISTIANRHLPVLQIVALLTMVAGSETIATSTTASSSSSSSSLLRTTTVLTTTTAGHQEREANRKDDHLQQEEEHHLRSSSGAAITSVLHERHIQVSNVPDCNTCGSGRYSPDGCNTCTCSRDRTNFACTADECSTTKPKCLDEVFNEGEARPEDSPTPANQTLDAVSEPLDCEVCNNGIGYFDGCNDCLCNPDGTESICTFRACGQDDKKESYCYDKDHDISFFDVASCETCPTLHYFDGCNECTCSFFGAGGYITSVTPHCLTVNTCSTTPTTSEAAYCIVAAEQEPEDILNTVEEVDIPDAAVVVDTSIGCSTCSSGRYNDGCNDCICEENEEDGTYLEICTEMACTVFDEPYCIEVQPPVDEPPTTPSTDDDEDCIDDVDITLDLWDADLDIPIGPLGDTIDLCELGKMGHTGGLTIVATPTWTATNCVVRKLKFRVYDSNKRMMVLKVTEKNEPYALFKNKGNDMYAAPILRNVVDTTTTSYTLTVIPKPHGTTKNFVFDVVHSDVC